MALSLASPHFALLWVWNVFLMWDTLCEVFRIRKFEGTDIMPLAWSASLHTHSGSDDDWVWCVACDINVWHSFHVGWTSLPWHPWPVTLNLWARPVVARGTDEVVFPRWAGVADSFPPLTHTFSKYNTHMDAAVNGDSVAVKFKDRWEDDHPSSLRKGDPGRNGWRGGKPV